MRGDENQRERRSVSKEVDEGEPRECSRSLGEEQHEEEGTSNVAILPASLAELSTNQSQSPPATSLHLHENLTPHAPALNPNHVQIPAPETKPRLICTTNPVTTTAMCKSSPAIQNSLQIATTCDNCLGL